MRSARSGKKVVERRCRQASGILQRARGNRRSRLFCRSAAGRFGFVQTRVRGPRLASVPRTLPQTISRRCERLRRHDALAPDLAGCFGDANARCYGGWYFIRLAPLPGASRAPLAAAGFCGSPWPIVMPGTGYVRLAGLSPAPSEVDYSRCTRAPIHSEATIAPRVSRSISNASARLGRVSPLHNLSRCDRAIPRSFAISSRLLPHESIQRESFVSRFRGLPRDR
jgi:hypothetical protein